MRWLIPVRRMAADRPASARWLAERFGPRVLVMAPHCDDAPYSVAGTMRALVEAGVGVEMLTLFGHSTYAPYRPGLDAKAVSALRQAEDRAAAAAIHPDIAVRAWDHPDVALRRDLPVEQVVSKAPLDADAQGWIERLTEDVDRHRGAGRSVLAPLGMGWHIDHRIVAATGAALARRSVPVHFFEDLPYAGFTRSNRLWLAQAWRLRVLGLPLRAVDLCCPDLMALRRQVYDHYPSQASPEFWAGLARQAKRRRGAERLWVGRPATAV